MCIFGRYGSWFLWVIQGLQAVGPQIRSFGPRKWSGYLYFCIISLHPNISDIFTSEYVYFHPNVYIFAQVSRSLGWFWSYRVGKLGVNMRHLWSRKD